MIFSLNVCAAERLAANSQASNEAIDDSEFEFLIERERATDGQFLTERPIASP